MKGRENRANAQTKPCENVGFVHTTRGELMRNEIAFVNVLKNSPAPGTCRSAHPTVGSARLSGRRPRAHHSSSDLAPEDPLNAKTMTPWSAQDTRAKSEDGER